MTNILDAALNYRSMGLSVIPIDPKDIDKKPYVAWTEYKTRIASEEEIRSWWHDYPDANVGIVTGKVSGVFVLDCDDQEAIDHVEKLGIKPTACQTTSRGKHFVFRYFGDHIQNVVRLFKKANDPKICGLKIDIRGDNGYFVAAPSIHFSGHRYSWKKELNRENLADAPDWLVTCIADLNSMLVHLPVGVEKSFTGENAWSRKAFNEDIAAVRNAPKGIRHDTLLKSAIKLSSIAKAGKLNKEKIQNALFEAAMACGLERKEWVTIENGWDYADPRALPELPEGEIAKEQTAVTDRLYYEIEPVDFDALLPYYGTEDSLKQRFMIECLKDDEHGDAKLLSALYLDRILFDAQEGKWYVWGGHIWQEDDRKLIHNLVDRSLAHQWGQLADALALQSTELEKQLKEAGISLDDIEKIQAGDKDCSDENKKLIDNLIFALAFKTKASKRKSVLQKLTRASRVLSRAEMLSNTAINSKEWDSKRGLLAVQNGVIDLTTGELRAGRPTDKLRSFTPIKWEGINTSAPRWERFLDEVFANNVEVIEYVQRLIGYASTGYFSERILPILCGIGANGKSIFLDTISSALGEYATTGSRDILMTTGKGQAGSATPHLMVLRTHRLVVISETSEGGRFNSEQVKNITGDPQLTGRQLNQAFVTWDSIHTLFLITNHKPTASADDQAIFDRVHLLAFTQRFVDDPKEVNEHLRDPNLKTQLQRELPGILAWIVKGAIQYCQQGLNPPKSVLAATEQYRADLDVLSDFIDECCEVGELLSEGAQILYKGYKQFCEDRSEWVRRDRQFKEALAHKGIISKRDNKGVRYLGIKLIPSALPRENVKIPF